MGGALVMWFGSFYVAISLIFCLHGVDGRHLTIEESLEHNSSNISHSKTIKTKYGDIYDCVDLYKQPAFQHPLLKHHKIKDFPKQNEVSDNLRYGLKEGCPQGTIPIRRTTKEEELLAQEIFTQQFQPYTNLDQNNQQNRFAGVTSGPVDNSRFGYASASISTHNPQVGNGQLSGSVISAECDVGGFETIRVGWMVYPDMYKGDTRTRLFTAWGASNIYKGTRKGCFNTQCPGFVQTNPKIPPDFVISPISVPAGAYSYIELTLERQADGSWYLIYKQDNKQDAIIGHWPGELFHCLNGGAKLLSWGGWVSSLTQNLPVMGSGLKGNLGSLFRQVNRRQGLAAAVTPSMMMNNVTGILRSAGLQVSQNNCYKAGFTFYQGAYWGDSFWYGGDGGNVNQCPN